VLQGKIIVVIGGTSGLGLSGAKALQDAGANVLAVGLDDEHLPGARDALKAENVLVGDATLPQTSTQAIAAAAAKWGRVDGLYHVAGGSGRRKGDGPLHELTDEGWHYTLQLNLTSQFYSNRAAVRQFLQQGGGGAILNVASVLAEHPSPQFFATHAYTAAKAAVIGMTRSAAACYAPQNIRFNALAPGLVETPMSQRAVGDAGIAAFVRSRQPLDGGRVGQPADLDAAVVFLLSDQAKFITGQVLSIDGGWSVSEGRS
jgi:NAD(P)-dependent dehydrogenase (short-subunit alcohol dehydrogenase family)